MTYDMFGGLPPRQRMSRASVDAAIAIAPKVNKLQRYVLDCIRTARAHGATDLEVQFLMQMKGSTERPRRRELQKLGLVTELRDTDGKPIRRNGATVWVAIGGSDAEA